MKLLIEDDRDNDQEKYKEMQQECRERMRKMIVRRESLFFDLVMTLFLHIHWFNPSTCVCV